MRKIAILATIAVVAAAGTAVAFSDGGQRWIRLFLNGHQEVPVISTTGHGSFTARINKEQTEIAFELRYSELEGAITQSHIHFGPPNNTGGVSVWLCSNLASPPTPAGVAPCPLPPAEGVVEGVLSADDVVGPVGQGIEAGAWNELLAAMRAGKTYVNVHTSKWPGGEIRSQIEPPGHSGH